MGSLLTLWGAEIKTASSPQETEDLLKILGPPGLLIADLRLGEEENGLGMLHRLHESFGPFPVLMITGETSPQALTVVRKSGLDLLEKPVSAEGLQSAIGGIMAHSPIGESSSQH